MYQRVKEYYELVICIRRRYVLICKYKSLSVFKIRNQKLRVTVKLKNLKQDNSLFILFFHNSKLPLSKTVNHKTINFILFIKNNNCLILKYYLCLYTLRLVFLFFWKTQLIVILLFVVFINFVLYVWKEKTLASIEQ